MVVETEDSVMIRMVVMLVTQAMILTYLMSMLMEETQLAMVLSIFNGLNVMVVTQAMVLGFLNAKSS